MKNNLFIKVYDVGHPKAKCISLMQKDTDEILDSFGTGWNKSLTNKQILKEAKKYFKNFPKNIEIIME